MFASPLESTEHSLRLVMQAVFFVTHGGGDRVLYDWEYHISTESSLSIWFNVPSTSGFLSNVAEVAYEVCNDIQPGCLWIIIWSHLPNCPYITPVMFLLDSYITFYVNNDQVCLKYHHNDTCCGYMVSSTNIIMPSDHFQLYWLVRLSICLSISKGGTNWGHWS